MSKIGRVVDTVEAVLSCRKIRMCWGNELKKKVNGDYANEARTYIVNGWVFRSIIEELKGFGVQVHRSLKEVTQVDNVVRKAFGLLDIIGALDSEVVRFCSNSKKP